MNLETESFFIGIVKYTLQKKGIEVSTSQLTDFLQFVQSVPSSQKGDTWEKVGLDSKNWFTETGGLGMLLIAFAIWNALRKALADDVKVI